MSASGGSGLAAARPAALQGFAADGPDRVAGVPAATAEVSEAVNRFREAPVDPAFAVRVEDPGPDIESLAQGWTSEDAFVGAVGAAFARADAFTSGGVAYAIVDEVDTALEASGWSPFASLTVGDPAEWARLAGADRYFPNGGTYTGGGFIKGPDGRLYPLVIPNITDGEGNTFQADDGVGGGDISTLDGADPGWFTLYSRRGIGDTSDTSIGERLAAGFLAATGAPMPYVYGKPAGRGDYDGLRYGSGRPDWYYEAEPPKAQPGGMELITDQSGKPIRPPGWATGANLAGAALSAANAASEIDDAHLAAYNVLFEANPDGRRRARLEQYQITENPTQANLPRPERVIFPSLISVDPEGEPVKEIITYRDLPKPDELKPGRTDEDPGFRIWEEDDDDD
jgi:hypothetical protein